MLIDVVQTQIQSLFRHVDGAVNIEKAIKEPLNQSPVGFVLLLGERPKANSRDQDIGNPLQEVDVGFAVLLGVNVINDRTGGNSLKKMETLTGELRDLLFGWQPLTGYSPITLANSDIVGFSQGNLWWLSRFNTVTWRAGQA